MAKICGIKRASIRVLKFTACAPIFLLLKSRTDSSGIRKVLGHRAAKTTEIATRVSTKSIQQTKSPFDD